MARERKHPESVNAAAVLTGAAAIVGAVTLSLLAAWAVVAGLGGEVRSRPERRAGVPPPVLELRPQSDRAAYEAAEQRKLSEYGWIDRSQGRVRIPVEVAMARLSERAGESGETPR